MRHHPSTLSIIAVASALLFSLLTTPTAKAVDADRLYKEYVDNEIAADQTYKGKTITVSGTIKSIGKDIMNTPYVTLATGEFFSVQCFFSEANSKPLAAKSKGDSITVSGTCGGKFGNIMIKNCTLQ